MAKKSYQKNLVKVPHREVGDGKLINGRQMPTMTYMSDDLVPGSHTYIEMGWIYEMPEPNPHIHNHKHDYNELVIHIGADPQNPEELGAEIEFVVGGEKLTIDKTSAVFIPSSVEHGPLTWKKVKKPHIQMVVMPGAGTIKEANPAGYLPHND